MKQNKNVVRLTESQLKAMVAESVREALNEIDWGGLSHDEWNTFRREVNDINYDDYESNEEDFDTPSNVQNL